MEPKQSGVILNREIRRWWLNITFTGLTMWMRNLGGRTVGVVSTVQIHGKSKGDTSFLSGPTTIALPSVFRLWGRQLHGTRRAFWCLSIFIQQSTKTFLSPGRLCWTGKILRSLRKLTSESRDILNWSLSSSSILIQDQGVGLYYQTTNIVVRYHFWETLKM